MTFFGNFFEDTIEDDDPVLDEQFISELERSQCAIDELEHSLETLLFADTLLTQLQTSLESAWGKGRISTQQAEILKISLADIEQRTNIVSAPIPSLESFEDPKQQQHATQASLEAIGEIAGQVLSKITDTFKSIVVSNIERNEIARLKKGEVAKKISEERDRLADLKRTKARHVRSKNIAAALSPNGEPITLEQTQKTIDHARNVYSSLYDHANKVINKHFASIVGTDDPSLQRVALLRSMTPPSELVHRGSDGARYELQQTLPGCIKLTFDFKDREVITSSDLQTLSRSYKESKVYFPTKLSPRFITPDFDRSDDLLRIALDLDSEITKFLNQEDDLLKDLEASANRLLLELDKRSEQRSGRQAFSAMRRVIKQGKRIEAVFSLIHAQRAILKILKYVR